MAELKVEKQEVVWLPVGSIVCRLVGRFSKSGKSFKVHGGSRYSVNKVFRDWHDAKLVAIARIEESINLYTELAESNKKYLKELETQKQPEGGQL